MSTVITKLRTLRTTPTSDADIVVQLSRPLIASGGIRKAGDEAWAIYEQAFLAALEIGDDVFATTCLTRLSDRFPTSPKIIALRGLLLEAQDKIQEAVDYYDEMLKEDESNVPVMKRRAALFKSTGKPEEAVTVLTKLLDSVPNDSEAWSELADLYIQLEMHQQAAFCLEELLVLNPHAHTVAARYAELALRMGDYNLALKQFCRAVELCDGYERGLMGIFECSQRLQGKLEGVRPMTAVQRKHGTDGTTTAPIDEKTVKALGKMAREELVRVGNEKYGTDDDDAGSKKSR
ncbi:Inositol phosphatase SIW14 [Saitoella coloradoensis]